MNLLETLRATGKTQFTSDELISLVTDHTDLEALMDSGHLVAVGYIGLSDMPESGTEWRLASDLEVEVKSLAKVMLGDMMTLIKAIKRGEFSETKLQELKSCLSGSLDVLEGLYIEPK